MIGPQQAPFETSKEPVRLEGWPSHRAQAHQGWSPLPRILTIQGQPLSPRQGDHPPCPLRQRRHPLFPKFRSNQP